MPADAVPRLTLYSRRHCHLCDKLQAGQRFELEIIDVDRDPDLERRYGERVPLLTHRGREVCHYFLDRAAVAALLAEIR